MIQSQATDQKAKDLHSIILDNPLPKSYTNKVSLSFFSFLFSEVVKYAFLQVSEASKLEDRLHEFGIRIGYKVLELYHYRLKPNRRNIHVLSLLTFISKICWKELFGSSAELLKVEEKENEYMISDPDLILIKYITVPKDVGYITCASFVAGIVEGILCNANFAAEVVGHSVKESNGSITSMMLIRFLDNVTQ